MSNKPKNQNDARKRSKESQKEDPSSLPGWPGYRTRPGRSGYDPIDSDFEGAHIAGVVLRRFFTGQIKTRNPAWLLLLALAEILLTLPLILAVVETAGGNPMPGVAWTYLIPSGVIGLAALVNLIRNLIRKD
jgi:hypothetical protein